MRTENFKIPHRAQAVCPDDHKVREETVPSPVLSLECSSYSHPSFAKYPHPSIGEAVRQTPNLKKWFSHPSPPDHKRLLKGTTGEASPPLLLLFSHITGKLLHIQSSFTNIYSRNTKAE